MKKHIYNSLLAFSGGLFGVSILFILFYLFINVAHFKNPLPLVFYGYLITYLGYSFIEEGIKFLLIKKNIRQFPYSFFLGFGFGIGETILRYPFFEFGAVPLRRIWAILLHIITAGIIGYFAKKGKPALGLLIAIVLHTGFNLFIEYTFYK